MDPEREQELLLHIAAGTDLLTALAALPPAEQPQPEPTPAKSVWLVWLVPIGMVAVWWLFG